MYNNVFLFCFIKWNDLLYVYLLDVVGIKLRNILCICNSKLVKMYNIINNDNNDV